MDIREAADTSETSQQTPLEEIPMPGETHSTEATEKTDDTLPDSASGDLDTKENEADVPEPPPEPVELPESSEIQQISDETTKENTDEESKEQTVSSTTAESVNDAKDTGSEKNETVTEVTENDAEVVDTAASAPKPAEVGELVENETDKETTEQEKLTDDAGRETSKDDDDDKTKDSEPVEIEDDTRNNKNGNESEIIEDSTSNEGVSKTTEKTKDIEFVELVPCDEDREKSGPSSEFNLDEEDKEEGDPIASDTTDQQGADEELCIIPDTERVISQEEKEAAATIPPLRDLTETSKESAESTQKYIILKSTADEPVECFKCVLVKKPKFTLTRNDEVHYLCDDGCLEAFKTENKDNYVFESKVIRVKNLTAGNKDKDKEKGDKEEQPKLSFDRKCAECGKKTEDDETNLTWEIMDFCNEFCLSKYQKTIGSVCSNCSQKVRANSLGKYCVRFGNDIRQFCTSHCLEEFKKGLKVCSYCQQDMSSGGDGFLAPVGDKGQFKDFCSQVCMEKYDIMTNNRPPKVDASVKCSVCKGDNLITIEYDGNYFCTDRCFVAFSFVNSVSASKCSMCRRYFPNDVLRKNTMFYDNVQYSFCSNSCQNIYIIAFRKIVACAWCKVKKYNFDMIRRYMKEGPVLNMCSINCFSLFQVSVNAVSSKKTQCSFCNKRHQAMYHLTMSDATIRNFCTYSCVLQFQNKYKTPLTLSKDEDFPVPAGEPKKNRKYVNEASTSNDNSSNDVSLPVISNVQSLAAPMNKTARKQASSNNNNNSSAVISTQIPEQAPKVIYRNIVIIKPEPVPDQRNVSTMCRVKSESKGSQTSVSTADKEIQTELFVATKILIPVPVPVYVPAPLPMYTTPCPYPLPFPVPIPIPIFIPTTRNTAKGIMKEIKKIQVKIPTDPYEAELLMMAEMVAGDKKEENTDSESDVEENGAEDGNFSPEPADASNTFGDDMLQMALKMATELEEPAVDLEGALTANTITAPQGTEPAVEETEGATAAIQQLIDPPAASVRGRKRNTRGGRSATSSSTKRRRLSHAAEPAPAPATPPQPAEPQEKPDANFCLKYTFGVNAWKQWVATKNAELEKLSKYPKLFKTEILQLTADELNYSLCLFVKEVRKPNGAEYAPDTIYYLCLGIQQYLFENNRIDNIFCDPYYEQFTDSLDEIAEKFSVLYNDSHYIVTRVEEEHLWESKQLGAHSPHVLLSTLMFFNTKHFNLTSVEEHMQLSFSHIMKHWKRNPNQAGVGRAPGARNVLLRFYPPQSAMQNNTRKKKVYEQQENDENPLRCPVKLYEFYLSKCPESVKTRNDVFYLQPERSCVPDSPVWYSTTPLPREALEKMLHRVKMVKEINVALLTV